MVRIAIAGVLCIMSNAFAASFPQAAVAADHVIASDAGVEILKLGGNAVDAAVATSFTLSVVRPYSCGIGGGGFMVIRLGPNHPKGPLETAINYREQCPAAYGPTTYVNDKDPKASEFGGKAVAIPGTVAGLLYALDTYGSLPREKVLAPAIRVAESGFAADAHFIECAKEIWDTFDKHPDHRTRFAFLYDRFLGREKIALGDIIKLPEQARALRLIAAKGTAGFYEGEVADAIVRAVAADGGTLTHADLKSFTVSETKPLEARFTATRSTPHAADTSVSGGTGVPPVSQPASQVEYRILTMPPPSSGGIVVAQVFDILEYSAADLTPLAHNSAPYIHLLTEASKHAFADRARWLGDPAFADVPMGKLLAPAYLKSCADRIDMTTTHAPETYGLSRDAAAAMPEDSGTSHLSVVDSFGNAVACTETINLVYGSRICVPEFGFALNNEMDDFLTKPGQVNAFGLVEDERNLPMPGKRPLSSMTPIIALRAIGPAPTSASASTGRDGRPEAIALVAGASGGPRIITATIQAAMNVIAFDMPAEAAVTLPRFHHQWSPDTLFLEPPLRAVSAAPASTKDIVVESRAGDTTSSSSSAAGNATTGAATSQPAALSALEAALRSLGHKTNERPSVGTVQLIRETRAGGWDAASDPRKGGKPAGY
jgi:gamma-glutamyltranspeptidase / glutathione hydrolase